MFSPVHGDPAAGWYRDPVDKGSARFYDGRRWTSKSQPGAARLIGGHATSRPRAAMTRQELLHRRRMMAQPYLGQYVDTYL